MKSQNRFTPALVLLLAFPLGFAHAQYPQGGNQGAYQQQGGWDAPPSEFSSDLQRHAFHDGIEAARADMSSGTQPNPESHEEFRHPHVPYDARDTYRDAYKRGYFIATRHMQEHQEHSQQVPPPPPDYRNNHNDWDAAPSEYADDLQRNAFHDGIEAARADLSGGGQPNPEAHDEFRHPHVPFLARETYREAYKRGYFTAVRHMQERGR